MAWNYEETKIYNRTTGTPTERKLNVRWDGVDKTIPLGESSIPKHVVSYAIAQNPVMGSEDEIDPSDFESLIGVVGSKKFPCTPVEENPDALSRIDITRIISDRGDKFKVKGKKKPRAYDAFDVRPHMGAAGILAEQP